jgi:uncharacterized protein YllA (UPF0747 family)
MQNTNEMMVKQTNKTIIMDEQTFIKIRTSKNNIRQKNTSIKQYKQIQAH